MGINGVSSYANTYTYGNVKNENVKPSKNSEKNYYAGYTMNSANKFKNVSDYSKFLRNISLYQEGKLFFFVTEDQKQIQNIKKYKEFKKIFM
jgi:hypothetical protein